jgi:hypothetical protein
MFVYVKYLDITAVKSSLARTSESSGKTAIVTQANI